MRNFSFSQAQDLCADDGKQTVEVHHSFPEENPDLSSARCVLLTLHDGNTDFPLPAAAEKVVQPVRGLLRNFLHVERDVGTNEVAAGISQQVRNAVWFRVLVPRIVDLNRAPLVEDGHVIAINGHLRKEVPDEAEAEQALTELHATTRTTLEKLVSSCRPAVALDIHSMAPFDPPSGSPTLLTSETSLRQHVDRWNTFREGNERPTQIFHSGRDADDKDGKDPVSFSQKSVEFASMLAESFSVVGQTSFTKPFGHLVHGRHLSGEFLALTRAPHTSAIDMPKDLLARAPEGVPKFLLEKIEPDAVRIQRVVDAVVRTLSRVLS